ncbi:MAG: BatA domain-containing protein [Phycisphaerales bacterium]|nr:BatA domain-containing protein [Phycisphaerales bacterium]
MSFVTPGLALLVGAIAIPSLVILYFLKLRRRELEISSTLLWRRAIQDLQANAPFQRLRRNILLLIQLLAILAALFALAQPERRVQADRGQRLVIAIDRSASMQTRDGAGRSRLDGARHQALELVEAMRAPGVFSGAPADEAMVVAFDVTGEVVQAFTSDKDALRRAIRAIEPTDGASRLVDAMRLVRAQAPGVTRVETYTTEDGRTEERTIEDKPRGVGTIHLFTDGRLPDAAEAAESTEDEIVYHAPAEPDATNFGVVALQAARSFDDPAQLSIFVGVGGCAAGEADVDVELRLGDTSRVFSVRVRPLDASQAGPPSALSDAAAQARSVVPVGGSSTVTLTHPEAAMISVRLAGSAMERDQLESDNEAWLAAPAARRLRVLMVGPSYAFLDDVLDQMGFGSLERIATADFSRAVAEGRVRKADVVVIRGELPEGELPPGRYLMLGTIPASPLGPRVTGERDRARFVTAARDHPATRLLVLDGVLIARMASIEIPKESSVRVLAETDQGPGIIECTGDEIRAIVTTFDPLESSWSFDVSFPLFIAEAIDALARDPLSDENALSVRPGGVITQRLPGGAGEARLREPDDEGRPRGPTHDLTAASDGRIVFGPVRRRGVYELSWAGPGGDFERDGRSSRLIAANLLDPNESDVAVAPELALASRVVIAGTGEGQRVRSRLWPWFILGCLGLVLVEWYVYNRKVRV